MGQKPEDIYGIVSQNNILRIRRRSLSSEDALAYNYEDYCLPFMLRLSMKLEDLGLLPEECEDGEDLQRFIRHSAENKGIRIRSTWFSNDADPGEFRDNDTTRENIYAFCAVLDADYEDCLEIWHKVFFKCPFLPKRRTELIFYYFAKQAYDNGEQGSGWYRKSLAFQERLQDRTCEENYPPVYSSREITKAVASMSEQEFEKFLLTHTSTFSDKNPGNEFQTARELIRKLVNLCWEKLCEEEGNDTNRQGSPFVSQNDTLIDGILGFRQRGVSIGLSELGLPKQLTSCFPTGKILGDIIGRGNEHSGDNNLVSLDELSKMAVLLLFYYYFSVSGMKNNETRFQGFVDMANENLLRAGLNYLYPGQPYNSFILFLAAADEPVEALRSYFTTAFERKNQSRLCKELTSFVPALQKTEVYRIVERLEYSDFYIRLASFYLKYGYITPKQIDAAACGTDPESALLKLSEHIPAGIIRQLAEISLIPRSGISNGLYEILFPSSSKITQVFLQCGLLQKKKSLFVPDSMLNRFMRQCECPFDRIRDEVVERADKLSMQPEMREQYGLEIATVLAVHAPKYLFMKRANVLLEASRLFSEQNADEKQLQKALECGSNALEHQVKVMSRQKRENRNEKENLHFLSDLYKNLCNLYGKLGNSEDADRYAKLAENCATL